MINSLRRSRVPLLLALGLLLLGVVLALTAKTAPPASAIVSTDVKICNHGSSWARFDVFKTDGSYNNELPAGACTGSLNNTGSNPVRMDLSDDGANEMLQYTHLLAGTSALSDGSDCNIVFGVDVTQAEPIFPQGSPATQTIRIYPPDLDGGDLQCGLTNPAPAQINSSPEPTSMADGTNCKTDPEVDPGHESECPNKGTDPEVYN
jgi:hypothetical protein